MSESEAAADYWIEKLTWLMDNSIPIGGKYSIGLDPIIGLVPGIGDLIGALVSSFIILQAHRAGVPRATILRMMANVGIDAAVGALPFLGDIFDFAFKANRRNLELYRTSIAGTHAVKRDYGFLLVILLGLSILLAVPILVIAWLASVLFQRVY